MTNVILYVIPALIWGSTWFIIKFQLGPVDPLISVMYRFLMAAILLFVYCLLTGRRLTFSIKDHVFMLLQGGLLFGLNYWLVYLAEEHLTSGLVCMIFSLIILMNMFNGAIFLGTSIRIRMLVGAASGILGIGLLFWEELFAFSLNSENSMALLLAVIGAFFASLGSIISARHHTHHLPVLSTTAYAMLYGGGLMLIIALIMGTPFTFTTSPPYLLSLLFLAVFGSVVAFSCYLTLIGRIGAGKAAYIILISQLIALILSTMFEDYRWTVPAAIGIVLIFWGNFLVLKKSR